MTPTIIATSDAITSKGIEIVGRSTADSVATAIVRNAYHQKKIVSHVRR